MFPCLACQADLQCLNPYLKANTPRMRRLLRRFARPPTLPHEPPPRTLTVSVDLADLATVCRLLDSHRAQVAAARSDPLHLALQLLQTTRQQAHSLLVAADSSPNPTPPLPQPRQLPDPHSSRPVVLHKLTHAVSPKPSALELACAGDTKPVMVVLASGVAPGSELATAASVSSSEWKDSLRRPPRARRPLPAEEPLEEGLEPAELLTQEAPGVASVSDACGAASLFIEPVAMRSAAQLDLPEKAQRVIHVSMGATKTRHAHAVPKATAASTRLSRPVASKRP
jgi:hypothetical protein